MTTRARIRGRALVAAAALVLGLLSAGPAQAGHIAGACPTWTGHVYPYAPATSGGVTTCYFFLRGLPMTIAASATSTGTASVHVWADFESPTGGTYSPPFLECSARGAGHASCSASASIGSAVPILGGASTLIVADCHVQGTGGTFDCEGGPIVT